MQESTFEGWEAKSENEPQVNVADVTHDLVFQNSSCFEQHWQKEAMRDLFDRELLPRTLHVRFDKLLQVGIRRAFLFLVFV